MRIGFDARMLDHAGIGRYIGSLLPEIVRQSHDDMFFIYGSPEKIESVLPFKNVTAIRWEAPIYSAFEQVFLPFKDIDLLHVPHFNIPIRYKGKLVVTVHDLIHLLFPGYNKYFFTYRIVNFLLGQSLSKASKIIAVSNNTKKDLIRMFGDEYERKVNVIYEAANYLFREIGYPEVQASFKKKYNLKENIILYVGSVRPHKNVPTLIGAFNILKRRNPNCQLVICGKWERENGLRSHVDGENIIYAGELPMDELPILYNVSDLTVTLSSYEGFGLTILESMQCGTPVIAYNSSSIPEVAGKAAFLISSLKIEDVAENLYNILFNNELRVKMSKEGLARAMDFSWEKAAKDTIKIYKSL